MNLGLILLIISTVCRTSSCVASRSKDESRKTLRPDLGITRCVRPGVVALTFDDGPSTNGKTQEVLNVLREMEAVATFFVTGNRYDKSFLDSSKKKASLLKQAFDDGHQIGSHTWAHANYRTDMTKEFIKEDIHKLSRTVRNITGVSMTIFRPPYGAGNKTIGNVIEKEFGYKIVNWNLDTLDWKHKTNVGASLKRYRNAFREASNATHSYIVLHHDPLPGSAVLARQAIEFVRSKGFQLVTVGECIGVPDHKK